MFRNFKLGFPALAILSALCTVGVGAEMKGVKFAESVKVDGKDLVLNGLGLRTATIFKVSVYAAGLYLPSKTKEATEALSFAPPKQLQMEFLRDVGAKDMRDAWNTTFKDNCETSCEAGKEALEKLKALLVDLKKGDRMVYTLRADTVELAINGTKKGEVKAKDFPMTVLSTWIGKHPPNEGLREGLLGKGE